MREALPPPFGPVSRVLRFLAGLLLLAVATPVTALVALPLLPSRVLRIKLHNLYGKLVGRAICAVAGVSPRVRGAEHLDGRRPAIYVANHASNLDFFVCIWLCPFGGCGVVKKEFVWLPFVGQLYLLSGHLRIDRGDRAKAVAALAGTATLVRAKGLSMWIMPEGTRSADGRLLPFKKGFVHLAIATGLPVVPVVIHDAHRHWPKGRWLDLRGGTLDVEVLPPVDTSAWREETSADHAGAVRALMADALDPAQRPAARVYSHDRA